MKKKFNVITILALLGLIVASSITLGKAFAYFSADSSASGTITMGTLSIGDVKTSDGASVKWDIGNLQPNQSFGGSYKVDVTSDINYYTRILFKASVTPQAGSTHINGTGCGDYVTDDTDILNISIDGNYSKSNIKTSDGYTAYYKLSPTSATTTAETFNIDLKVADWVGSNYCDYYMKASVTLNMRVQVMQADYLESNATGGTVSSASDMHELWVAGGIEAPTPDVSEYSNLTFTILNSTNKTMSVKTASTDITEANIPARVKKDGEVYTVTGIANSGFSNCSNLTSVTIPDTVTSVGEYAFNNCTSLEYSTYDNAKYLGNADNPYMMLVGAINTDITSCEINSNCKVVIDRAFKNCTALTSISIPEGVTSIGKYAFYQCTGLATATIPTSVTSIGEFAFAYCSSLTSITIPEGVTSIGDSLCNRCTNLTSVTLPTTITSIGSSAFQQSNITTINIPEGVTTIGESAFAGCSLLTSVTIPNSVTSLGTYVFSGCTNLTSITIQEGVTKIWNKAFSGCDSLASVSIPSTVTSIGYSAFNGCDGLTTITLPSGLTSIGYSAFAYSGLTSISIPNSIESVGYSAFSGCDDLAFTTYSDALYLGNDDNPYLVLVCAECVYTSYNTKITSCTINSNCKVIAGRAFYNCSNLTSITIPNGVTSLGDYAFYGCTKLTSISTPSSVTNIGEYTFKGCTGLTSVTLTNGLTSIGREAFSGCTGLTTITIPETVTQIGAGAFYNSTSLTEIIFENTTGWYLNQSGKSYPFNMGNASSNASMLISSSYQYISFFREG